MTGNPTHRTYTGLDAAHDDFNRDLSGGKLPSCLITIQRHKGAYGYFSGDRFASTADAKEITDEIALNRRFRVTTDGRDAFDAGA